MPLVLPVAQDYSHVERVVAQGYPGNESTNPTPLASYRPVCRSRVEQSYLRQILFRGEDIAMCSLCGRQLPIGLLVAAHIKPRSDCSRRERLDAGNIVFSACLLGCDALYERGLIAVDSGGRVLTSDAQRMSTLNTVLTIFQRRFCGAWNATTAEYFRWHMTRRFQGSQRVNRPG
jgi:hypothetical protein